jgi:hypothetical protein
MVEVMQMAVTPKMIAEMAVTVEAVVGTATILLASTM